MTLRPRQAALVGAVVFTAGTTVGLNFGEVFPLGRAATVHNAVHVYFSPRGGCTQAIVQELDRAKRTVLVQAYSFTSALIAASLVDALRRGVEVQVILDDSNRTEKYSPADFVAHAKIPTFIDAQHAIAHNKLIIIDGQTVITGSFNFSKAAETSNAENLLVIRDATIAAQYRANWDAHKAHSEPYFGK